VFALRDVRELELFEHLRSELFAQSAVEMPTCGQFRRGALCAAVTFANRVESRNLFEQCAWVVAWNANLTAIAGATNVGNSGVLEGDGVDKFGFGQGVLEKVVIGVSHGQVSVAQAFGFEAWA
jgi:hypothetical protein